MAQQGTITADEWRAYQERFVTAEGRVVDDANGGISHSEGQGYGLLLAFMAGDQPSFARIWSFTRTELLLRDDGLAVWRWEPDATPHVTDPNNASDGDLLIAYALALAGGGWRNDDYLQQARRIADALGKTSIYRHGGEVLLRPAVTGFSDKDRADGPVINLSYWVFEALPVMQGLAPDHDWAGLERSGLKLILRSMSEDHRLPTEWTSVRRAPEPAEGFDPFFSYNALRIPLYLARGNEDGRDVLQRLIGALGDTGEGLPLMNVVTGAVTERLTDPGYRIIAAVAECRLRGTPVPADLLAFAPTNYYPSTLHLLALAHLREDPARCSG